MGELTQEERVIEPLEEQILEADSELRIELELTDKTVSLRMKSGYAEIFGAEMIKNKMYILEPGAKIAVFSWHGCTLEVGGKPSGCYLSKETPMLMYLNTHAALEQLRRKADEHNKRGPIVMIVGPTDVGKSTLARILVNYAIRSERKPVFVDLDVGQGEISIPGTIGATFVEKIISMERGFNNAIPFVFHYGHTTPSANIDLYNGLMSKMQNHIQKLLESNKTAKNSGVIINTCGWIKNDGYRSIIHAAKTFEVDAIIVLDQERLYNELVRDVPDFVKIVFLPKSCGVVERSVNYRTRNRDIRTRDYFYGNEKVFKPHRFNVTFTDIHILRLVSPAVPGVCLPHNTSNAKDNEIVKFNIVNLEDEHLLHSVLAISYAENLQSEILGTNIMGFVSVTNVEKDKGEITVLSPLPEPLPNNILLMSDLKFIDNH